MGCLLPSVRTGVARLSRHYEGTLPAVNLTVLGGAPGFHWKNPGEWNFIDKHVNAKLERLHVLPSELSNDADFLRRVGFDLIGVPPGRFVLEGFARGDASRWFVPSVAGVAIEA